MRNFVYSTLMTGNNILCSTMISKQTQQTRGSSFLLLCSVVRICGWSLSITWSMVSSMDYDQTRSACTCINSHKWLTFSSIYTILCMYSKKMCLHFYLYYQSMTQCMIVLNSLHNTSIAQQTFFYNTPSISLMLYVPYKQSGYTAITIHLRSHCFFFNFFKFEIIILMNTLFQAYI